MLRGCIACLSSVATGFQAGPKGYRVRQGDSVTPMDLPKLFSFPALIQSLLITTYFSLALRNKSIKAWIDRCGSCGCVVREHVGGGVWMWGRGVAVYEGVWVRWSVCARRGVGACV